MADAAAASAARRARILAAGTSRMSLVKGEIAHLPPAPAPAPVAAPPPAPAAPAPTPAPIAAPTPSIVAEEPSSHAPVADKPAAELTPAERVASSVGLRHRGAAAAASPVSAPAAPRAPAPTPIAAPAPAPARSPFAVTSPTRPSVLLAKAREAEARARLAAWGAFALDLLPALLALLFLALRHSCGLALGVSLREITAGGSSGAVDGVLADALRRHNDNDMMFDGDGGVGTSASLGLHHTPLFSSDACIDALHGADVAAPWVLAALCLVRTLAVQPWASLRSPTVAEDGSGAAAAPMGGLTSLMSYAQKGYTVWRVVSAVASDAAVILVVLGVGAGLGAATGL